MPVAALPELAAGLEGGAAAGAEGGAAAEGGGMPRMIPGMGGGKSSTAAKPRPTIEAAGKYTSEMLNPHQFSPFG